MKQICGYIAKPELVIVFQHEESDNSFSISTINGAVHIDRALRERKIPIFSSGEKAKCFYSVYTREEYPYDRLYLNWDEFYKAAQITAKAYTSTEQEHTDLVIEHVVYFENLAEKLHCEI